ncbi:MAG: SDR family NAD(P)-dependent oxidoreductase [Acidimicrobiia bacterium]
MTYKDSHPIPHYPSFMRLDGRNLIVIGAGQGMGRQTSHALKQCGARVVCADIDEQLAREIAEEVGGTAVVGDMTKEANIERLVTEASAAFGGPIHGFVDIIGIAEWEAIVATPEAMWDRQFDMCIRHAFLLAKHVGGHMQANKVPGTMVFIASVHGMTASVRHAAYGAAKAGLISLVKTIAEEMGPDGIRANAVAPGSILTPRMEIALDDATRAKAAAASVLNVMGKTSDIASAALFLTSAQSSFITGQTLVVDGGAVVADPFNLL